MRVLVCLLSLQLVASIKVPASEIYTDPEAIYRNNTQHEVVNADFRDDIAGSAKYDRLEHLVLSGPRFTDAALFHQLHLLKSLKFLALDSTSISDDAVDRYKKEHPNVTVYRSQRYAIAKLKEIDGPWNPRITVQLDKLHPEMRKLFGDTLFETIASIDNSFISDEQPGAYPGTFSHELRWLQYCPTIKKARLSWCRIDDAGAQYLLRLPCLSELWVIGNELSIRGVRDLAGIPSLRSFYFSLRPGQYAPPELIDLDERELKSLNPDLEIMRHSGW